MTLRLGGQTVPVAQMGPTFILLTKPLRSPARSGVITLTVDGVSEEIPVMLPSGISADSKRVEIVGMEWQATVAA